MMMRDGNTLLISSQTEDSSGMGGGTSKFESTNWHKANGRLTRASDTVDGLPPTREYASYRIVKKGMNQREFDVLSSTTKELIYTTRAVPGTLAWFDLLDPRKPLDKQEVLRVQVDLSRRTWMIYRYHTPIFPCQRPATLDPRKALGKTKLYKAACITVSWSRYSAVMAPYGPPSLEYLASLDPTHALAISNKLANADRQEDNETLLKADHPANTGMQTCVSHDSNDDLLEQARELAVNQRTRYMSTAAASLSSDNQSLEKDNDDDNDILEDLETKAIPSETTQTKSLLSKAVCGCSPENLSPRTSLRNPSSFDDLVDLIMTPDQEAYLTAIEGMIDLNKGPLVQCQEIYNKIIGNHQTSLVDKEQVIRLLQLDEAAHYQQLLDSRNSSILQPQKIDAVPSRLDEDELNPLIKALHEEEERTRHTINSSSISTTSSNSIELNHFILEKPGKDASHEPANTKSWFDRFSSSNLDIGSLWLGTASPEPVTKQDDSKEETSQKKEESIDEMKASLADVMDKQSMKKSWFGGMKSSDALTAINSKQEVNEVIGSVEGTGEEKENKASRHGKSPRKKTKSTIPIPQNEPLIAYWSWKNSLTVHKMELHLGKQSDLALHVVMAILCNQVRYERNALAMTV